MKIFPFAISIGGLKAPDTVYTKWCPECCSSNIRKSHGHVYCLNPHCLWDSVAPYERLAAEKFGVDFFRLALEKFANQLTETKGASL